MVQERQTVMVLFGLRLKLIPKLTFIFSAICLGTLPLSLLGVKPAIADSSPAQVPHPQISLPQYQTQGVIFEAPPGFSDLKPLGGKTVGIILPSGQARPVSVRLAELKPDTLGMATLEPREFAEYARYSFFGITATPKQHKIRRFLGQDVTGDVLMQSNNGSTTYLEFYVVPLTLGRQLAIAFETDTELPVYLLEKTIQTVAESMHEIPPKAKR
jgi:hypothetical protein